MLAAVNITPSSGGAYALMLCLCGFVLPPAPDERMRRWCRCVCYAHSYRIYSRLHVVYSYVHPPLSPTLSHQPIASCQHFFCAKRSSRQDVSAPFLFHTQLNFILVFSFDVLERILSGEVLWHNVKRTERK